MSEQRLDPKDLYGSIDWTLPMNIFRVTGSEEVSVSQIDLSDFYRTQEDAERSAALESALQAWRME